MKIFSVIIATLLLASCYKPITQVPLVTQKELIAETKNQHILIAKNKIRLRAKHNKRMLRYQERLSRVSLQILDGGIDLCSSILSQDTSFCIYKFELLQESTNEMKKSSINAFADGKKIYVTQGMMKFIKTDEELALILGHEYAHNLMAHPQSSTKNETIGKFVGSAIDVLAKTHGIKTRSIFKKIGKKVGEVTYSIEYEKEADYIGLYVAAIAGYDISNAPNFWRRMSLKHPHAVYNSTTHPSNPERFVALEKAVTEIAERHSNGTRLFPKINNFDVNLP